MRSAVVRFKKEFKFSDVPQDEFKILVDLILNEVQHPFKSTGLSEYKHLPPPMKDDLDIKLNNIAKDFLHRINHKIPNSNPEILEGKLTFEDAIIEILEVNKRTQKFEFKLHLISQLVTLLDSINGNIHLAIGDYSKNILEHTPIPNVFVMKNQPNLEITEYKST